ncbi:hypothetical protein [Phenylobacterium sp.]|uniref:hypothetical protein n=1 Tax=Phenylobacterium sp. TaxID=1871053 RepID=UPI0025D2AF78|nr:hypothetical protein [Phenylobacterium sp.]MBX3482520.1 hypothetical protein [Phenylobacterium sp.]
MSVASQDLFELASRGPGGAQAIWRIRCAKCAATVEVVNGARGLLPPDMLVKKFAGAGFKVSRRNPSHHLCAACQARPPRLRLVASSAEAARPEPVNPEAAAVEDPMPQTADAPRQPTREERQTIHAAIDKHWSVSGGGTPGT